MRLGKTLSLLLILAMIIATMSITASASYSLTGFGTDVESIEITGASVQSVNLVATPFTSGSLTCYRYTYNVVLSGITPLNATVTATFAKSDTAIISPVPPNYNPGMINAYKRLDYDVTLSSGSGSVTTYLYHDLFNARGNTDVYIFNYSVSAINNPITVGTGGDISLRFGDPAYPYTTPESLMSFSGSGAAYDAVYTGADSADFYPGIISLLAEPQEQVGRLSGSGVSIATYDSNGNKTTHSSITPAQNINNGVRSDQYTIEIGASGGTLTIYEENNSTVAAAIDFAAPKSLPAGGGTPPSAVNGYLPVGQFATGSSWGAIGTSANSLSTPKFVGGYSGTGVSLGMLGGYVQFDMESNPIMNDADNPYGVDFIIYGNAFNGNPEAGSVQVSSDGINWYELAGSRYYDSGTTRGISVTYINMTAVDTGLNSAFTSAGVYASRNYTGNISTATWAKMGANSWWPLYDTEGYGAVYNDGAVKTTPNTPYTNWDKSGTYELITYKNVTEVPDSDTNGFYQFGYFDITPNGTSYGNAANPYETYLSTKTGGDGFDISWAVNASGQPVNLASVRYVRAYSSVLHNAGAFGETSAEVCGMYVANGTGSGAATAPTVKVGSATVTTSHMGTLTRNVYTNTTNITVTAATDYIYVNGAKVSSGTPVAISTPTGSTKYVQIITQDGTESPYITLIKLVH